MTNPIGPVITVVINTFVFILFRLSWKSAHKRTYLIICQILCVVASTLSTLIFSWFSIFDTGFIFVMTLLWAISDTRRTEFCPSCGSPIEAGQRSATCVKCVSRPPQREVGYGWMVIILVPISALAIIAIFVFTPVIRENGNRCYQEAVAAAGSNADAQDALGAPVRATTLIIGPLPGSQVCEDTHFVIYGSKNIGVVGLQGWNLTEGRWNRMDVWIPGKAQPIDLGQR
jgi:hypothetical protein